MVSIGNFIGELKFSGKFSRRFSALFAVYAGWWIVALIIAFIAVIVDYANYYIALAISQFNGTSPPGIINLYSFMSGFTLFPFFPSGLRLLIYIFIVAAVVCLPFAVFTAVLFPPQISEKN